jgi:hypothetical protein
MHWLRVISLEKEERIMRTLAKTLLALSFIGAAAVGSTVPVQAQVYFGFGHPYYHHYYDSPRYYDYYRGGTDNGCRPGWTIQGGVCKPYRHGPWDYYR